MEMLGKQSKSMAASGLDQKPSGRETSAKMAETYRSRLHTNGRATRDLQYGQQGRRMSDAETAVTGYELS